MFDWVTAAAERPAPEPYAPTRWVPVTRQHPCPVCGKDGWCSVAEDGHAAMCMRVADGAVKHVDLGHGTGHLHELGVQKTRADYYGNYAAPAPTPAADTAYDYEAVFGRWLKFTTAEALGELAGGLGVSVESLQRLGTAWCPERRVWAWPMYDARRQIIGVRFRAGDGRKFALTGSHSGVFLPEGLEGRGQVLIVEGPTDTAAALTLGYEAIGRPSATGAVGILCDLLGAGRRRDVIVVADNDGARQKFIGQYGARTLADRLIGLSQTVRVITPAPRKDLRAWLQSGATHDAVQARIRNAYPEAVMRFPWIKLRTDLHTASEILLISDALHCDVHAAVGMCAAFWSWATSEMRQHDGFLKGATLGMIDKVVGQAGFGETLVKVEWLIRNGEGLYVKNPDKHMSRKAMRRAQDQLRKAAERDEEEQG